METRVRRRNRAVVENFFRGNELVADKEVMRARLLHVVSQRATLDANDLSIWTKRNL